MSFPSKERYFSTVHDKPSYVFKAAAFKNVLTALLVWVGPTKVEVQRLSLKGEKLSMIQLVPGKKAIIKQEIKLKNKGTIRVREGKVRKNMLHSLQI